MDILWQISEKSNDIITLLNRNGFFDKPQFKHFCPKSRLRVELELKMLEKWRVCEEFNLTSIEFQDIINNIIKDEVSETIYDLLDSNKIEMSVNSMGKIVYSLTNEANRKFLYEDGFLKVFRNKN